MTPIQLTTTGLPGIRRPARALESGPAGATIEVEIQGAAGCARCASGRGCGSGLFNVGIAPVRLRCLAEQAVAAGDELQVEFSDTGSSWLWLVFGAYGLPTVGLMMSTVITALCIPDTLFPPSSSGGWRDLVLAIAALVGLSGGVIAWRMMARRVLLHLDKRLGLQTGRIVAAESIPLKPAVLSRPTCAIRENP